PVLERAGAGDDLPELVQGRAALGAIRQVRGERLALGGGQRLVQVLRQTGSPVVAHRATPSFFNPGASAAPCARGAAAISTSWRRRTGPASGHPPDPRPPLAGTGSESGPDAAGTAARTHPPRRSARGRRPLLPTGPPPMLDPCAVSPPRESCTRLDRGMRIRV